jgi:hypothetical protein
MIQLKLKCAHSVNKLKGNLPRESILLDTYTMPLDCSVGDATVGWPKGVNETVTLGMNERMVCEYARNFAPEEEIELFEIKLKDVVTTATVMTASSSTVEGAALNIRKPVRISEFNTCVRVEDSMLTVSVLADEFCESDRITYSLTYTAADAVAPMYLKTPQHCFPAIPPSPSRTPPSSTSPLHLAGNE